MQLACIEPGEVIELPAGTVLVSEGERRPFFYVILAGEIRLTRSYGHQEILMGVMKQGQFIGEVILLLGIPPQLLPLFTMYSQTPRKIWMYLNRIDPSHSPRA